MRAVIIVITKMKYRFIVFFGIFLRYFFGIWDTDFGFCILKYLGIRYRYRLSTQEPGLLKKHVLLLTYAVRSTAREEIFFDRQQ